MQPVTSGQQQQQQDDDTITTAVSDQETVAGSEMEKKQVLPPPPTTPDGRAEYVKHHQLIIAKEQLSKMHGLVKDLTGIRWPAMTEDLPSSTFLWRRLPKGRKESTCIADPVEVQLLQVLDSEGKLRKTENVELFTELMLQATKPETQVREEFVPVLASTSKGGCHA